MPGTIPLTVRITIALAHVRQARAEGDRAREWAWESMLNRMLDRYAEGHR